MIPSIGRIVHYVQVNRYEKNKPLQHLPAIITAVWPESYVCLQVFQDDGETSNSGDGCGCHRVNNVLYASCVKYDDTEMPARTWHWPEREEV